MTKKPGARVTHERHLFEPNKNSTGLKSRNSNAPLPPLRHGLFQGRRTLRPAAGTNRCAGASVRRDAGQNECFLPPLPTSISIYIFTYSFSSVFCVKSQIPFLSLSFLLVAPPAVPLPWTPGVLPYQLLGLQSSGTRSHRSGGASRCCLQHTLPPHAYMMTLLVSCQTENSS